MIVIFDPSKVTPRRTGPLAFDRIVLKPGANELSDDSVATLKKHPDFSTYSKALKFEEPEKDEPASPSTTRKTATKSE